MAEKITIRVSFGQSAVSLGIIGRVGENISRQILFDCSSVLTGRTSASIICVAKRPGDAEPYTVPLAQVGTTYVYKLVLTSAEVAFAGSVQFELRLLDGEEILKAAICTGTVEAAMTCVGDAPGSTIPDSLNRLDAAVEKVENMSVAVDAAYEAADTANAAAEAAEEAIEAAAPPITLTAEGSGALYAEDSVARPMVSLMLYGKTTQDGTPAPASPVSMVHTANDGNMTLSVGASLTSSDDRKTVTFPVPGGLAGLPVQDGGSYIDGEQHWVSDSVDCEECVIVRRIARKVLDGTEDLDWDRNENWASGCYIFKCEDAVDNPNSATLGAVMCSHAPATTGLTATNGGIGFGRAASKYFILNLGAEYSTLDLFKAYLAEQYAAGTPVTILYELETPVEEPLTSSGLLIMQFLEMLDGGTAVINDAYAYMKLEYIVDTGIYTTAIAQGLTNLRDNYPWDKNADLGENRVGTELTAPLRNGVKDIRLFGANPRDKHFLSYISYTDNTRYILSVEIQNQNGVAVCRYDRWYYIMNGVMQIPLTEQNASGIRGYITIDFDVFTLGNALNYDLSMMQETMLSELCYEAKDETFESLPSDLAALAQDFSNLRDNYPWDKNADLGESRVGTELTAPLKNGVKDIRLFGANPRDKHFLSYISYTDNTRYILSVEIQNQNGVAVCRYDRWYYIMNGVMQLPLTEQNASGITGSITIDFDVFTLGNALNYDLSMMQETMLSELCYGARNDELESVPGELAALEQNLTNLRDNYPWDKNADLGESRVGAELIAPLKNSIKDIRLFGANPRDRHYLSYISYTDSENLILTVNIRDQNSVIVCRYVEWYTFADGVVQLPLSEFGSSGITGTITIDFDTLPLGTALNYDASQMQETMLSELCYGAKDAELKLLLPDTIHTVVGRELSIYFANILLCDDLQGYQIDCVCDVGQQQQERFVYTPAAAGTHTLTIHVYRHFTQLVATATVTIQAHAPTGNGTTKKVCLIGDSWTANVWYPSYLQARFADDGNNIRLIGTIKPWGEYDGCPIIEGRSGWKAIDYATQASVNGVTNPFWNPSTGKFDFAYYLGTNSLETPDVVTIFLGINDVAAGMPTKTISAMQTMIDSILAANSATKIGVVLLPPPCLSQDGFGAMNGCSLTMHEQKRGAFELSEQYMANFADNESVFFIPVMSAVDMVHNVPFETVKANAYSEVEIRRVTDNVHCNEAGYQQVADAFYGALKALY